MAGNTFGKLFRITTFGESHGKALGVIIDGAPSGFLIDEDFIKKELARRRPGQSKLVTPRKEKEQINILSGVFEGKTTGTPIAVIIENKDMRSRDYSDIKDLFRPGHADFTYFAKYFHRDYRGGGRASARETAARVIGGAFAKQILSQVGIFVLGGVIQVGQVKAKKRDFSVTETNPLRSPDLDVVSKMQEEITEARKAKDSIGGVVEVVVNGVMPGLGEPVFDKLDASLSYAVMSIPAVKGIEIGEGFNSSRLRGSEMNDEMRSDGFLSNHHGGILGGISSGAPIVLRAAFKPTSSIPQEKKSINTSFENCDMKTFGRHDPCVALRAVPIVESMVSMVILDFLMREEGRFNVLKRKREDRVSYGLRDDIRDA